MRFFLLINLFSTLAYGFESNDVEKLMMNYLSSIKNKNKEALMSLTTEKYFKTLDKDNGVSELFSMQESSKNKINVDIKVIKQESGYRANIKNKSDKKYDHYWFSIVEENKKLLIDGTFHIEEPKAK